MCFTQGCLNMLFYNILHIEIANYYLLKFEEQVKRYHKQKYDFKTNVHIYMLLKYIL